MQDGCKLKYMDNTRCMKYDCFCKGLVEDKYKCPVWAEAILLEEYYNNKMNIERVLAGV